jgi:hypothetical protein
VSARHLPAARRFGDAAIHCQILEIQPDHPVIGVQGQEMHLLRQSQGCPFLQPTPNGAVRTAGGGDPLVARAMDQGSDHMLEDQAIRDALPVTPEGMGGRDRGMLGQQGRELDPERFE